VIGLIESRIKQEQKRAHNKRRANE
jgi:hypothetical protein